MELITILNRCHRFRGFVYQRAHFSANKKSIEVTVRPRKGSVAVCSRCHSPAPGYDQLAERRFEFIPVWGFLVFFLYTMRRVDCRRCGVVAVEEVPCGDGKRTLTKAYMLYLRPKIFAGRKDFGLRSAISRQRSTATRSIELTDGLVDNNKSSPIRIAATTGRSGKADSSQLNADGLRRSRAVLQNLRFFAPRDDFLSGFAVKLIQLIDAGPGSSVWMTPWAALGHKLALEITDLKRMLTDLIQS
jgi:hypothetical protein